MRTVLALLVCSMPLVAQDGRVIHVRTIYTFADGRQVVVEESGQAAKAASPLCRKCGEKCNCGAGCTCDAASYDGRCAAAPKIRATAPPAPPVIPPAVYYAPPPVYYPPPRYYAPMPAFNAGVRVGPFQAGACVSGR